jgi:hypothetical protein
MLPNTEPHSHTQVCLSGCDNPIFLKKKNSSQQACIMLSQVSLMFMQQRSSPNCYHQNIHIHKHTHTHTHVCACVYVHACMCVCMTCVYVHVCMYVCVCVCVCVYVCMYVCVYVYVCVCVSITLIAIEDIINTHVNIYFQIATNVFFLDK